MDERDKHRTAVGDGELEDLRRAAQIAHAMYHILDDAAEDAQTGEVTVEITKADWAELNRMIDLLGDEPHEVLHGLIGVNDPDSPFPEGGSSG